jgi:cytidine deaminase
MQQLRVSLIAPSGAGKSTVAGLFKSAFELSGRTVQILKLAAPLYQLQAGFYSECDVELAAGQQDQHLLEVIATEMRRIAPQSLVRHFGTRLSSVQADVVLNDDLRDKETDWPWLRRNGFIVVRVVAGEALRQQRLQGRGDLTLVKDSPLDVQIARIRETYTITNDGSLDALRAQVEALAARLLQSGEADVPVVQS